MSVWLESGKYHLRGNKPGQFVMARHGDVGPYAKDNVYICEYLQNLKDQSYFKRIALGPILPPEMRKVEGLNLVKSAASRGRGRGWYFASNRKTNPYKAKFRTRTIGCFATAEEAREAYLKAVRDYELVNGCI